MVRVPSTYSLEWLLGQREPEVHPSPLTTLSGAEVDSLIRRCAEALEAHGRDFEARRDDDALAAFESTMAILLELRDVHRNKVPDIDSILLRFGYPVAEN